MRGRSSKAIRHAQRHYRVQLIAVQLPAQFPVFRFQVGFQLAQSGADRCFSAFGNGKIAHVAASRRNHPGGAQLGCALKENTCLYTDAEPRLTASAVPADAEIGRNAIEVDKGIEHAIV